MNQSSIISIAISTFNRCNQIYSLVNNILLYKGTEIEVVVFNNASTDNTKEFLGSIKDTRLRVINNEKNIGGILGPLQALLEARSEYVFVCLDKDYLDPEKISIITEKLLFYKDKNIVFGKCNCNLDRYSPEIFFNNQYDILYNLVYLSEHPTGLFFRTKDLKQLNILDDITSKYYNFGFNSELLKAELSNLGNSLVLNIPAFKTESIQDCSKITSKTYGNNNLFFHPNFRVIELNNYLTSLNSLKLKINLSSKISLKIYDNILYSSTFGYRIILLNSNICKHYSINPVKLKFTDLIRCNYLITRNFLSEIYKKNKGLKFYFSLILVQIKWFLKFIFLYVRN